MFRIIALLLAAVLAAACAKSVVDNYDDASITARVKTVFVNDPVIGLQRIDVDTVKGVVTLSGRVRSKEDEQKAIELARRTRGVVEVKSVLQIGQ
jgi:osmotically-inducible protein OsmY